MSRTTFNNRGISMIEVLITLFLTTVGIMALLSMHPTSWQTAGRSDLMGRAAVLLQSELERSEIWIMNPGNAVTTGTVSQTVNASSQAIAKDGDAAYVVTRTIAPVGGSLNSWTVSIRVTWPGNNQGIAETLIASRQESFR